jgi:hypothetical protein
MPPSDPRYLQMTDDEIYFDFLTIQETERLIRKRREVDPDEIEEQQPAKLPEFRPGKAGGPDKSRSMAFVADEQEFREWFEREVGPWTTGT